MSLPQKIHATIAQQESTGALATGTGIAISAIKDGRVFFEDASGFRDREHRLLVTPDTIFELGSLTKAFTSAALVRASEAGKCDLNRPINSVQTVIALKDAQATQELSLTEVLSHTTGMAANDMLWYLPNEKPIDLIRSIAHLELIPGAFKKSFNYCSLMYGAVGRIFEQMTGTDWRADVRQKFLAPLQMSATSFDLQGEETNVAKPYAGERLLKRVDTTNIAAAASMRSSLKDMSRWVSFLLNETSVSQKLFDRHVKVEALNPILFQGLEWLGNSIDYGFGWFIGTFKGFKTVFHMGIIDGFSTAIVMVPEKKIGFVVLMNANLSPAPGLLIKEMIDHEV